MISPETVTQLARTTDRNYLTLYFNTGPDQPRSTYLARFRNLLKNVAPTVPADGRKQYDAVAAHVANHLEQYRPGGNSFLVYATERSWQEFTSRVPVRDEAHWGRPEVNQLLWLLEEYRPYGVLIADKQHVRFLAVRLNEFERYEEFSTEIDTSDWRKRSIGSSTRGAKGRKGGVDARAFDNRYAEQVRHFWRSLHKPVSELVARYHVKRLVLVGNKSLLPDFARSLPPALQSSVVIQSPMDGFSSPTAAVRKVYPEIEAWEEARDQAIVADLLDAAGTSRKAAVGIEAVLKHLQDGRVARLIVARDFDREVAQCGVCDIVTARPPKACDRCSGTDIRRAGLASSLARLVVRYGVPVDIVKRGPAEELRKNGGIGAVLRF